MKGVGFDTAGIAGIVPDYAFMSDGDGIVLSLESNIPTSIAAVTV